VSDYPIEGRAEDRLDRGRFVDGLVQGLRGLDASRGAVVAVLGPWGTGKSSVLNMVKEDLAETSAVVTVDFNPWLFSGTEELLSRFFGELARQLRLKDSRAQGIAQLFDDYAGALSALKWVPFAGAWLDRGSSILKPFVSRRLRKMGKSNSLAAQQGRLAEALASRNDPIVVVIDDIDRLQAQEVRDVLRLVRLTGSFPNVIYLLAFDRERVEGLLDGDESDGRAYLEKIVEYAYDLPAISQSALQRVLTSELDAVTARFPSGPFQADRWPDVFLQGLLPLFRTLRDVKRYHSVLPAALATIGDEVALEDVLALEAVRVLLPDFYRELSKITDVLTNVSPQQVDRSEVRARLESLLEGGSDDAKKRAGLTALLRLVFPACDQYFGGGHYDQSWVARWGRERRVASPAVLKYYLSRVLEPGVAPASLVAGSFNVLADETQLRQLLDDVDERTLENILERLESYEHEFPSEAAEPASVVLLDLLTHLRPLNARELFEIPPDLRVGRVVLRLLRHVDGLDLVTIVENIYRRVRTMNARMELVTIVGHMPNAGHKLVPEMEYAQLFRRVSHEIRHANSAQLSAERGPLRLLGWAVEQDPADRGDLDRQLSDPRLVLTLVRDALGYVQSRGMGSVAVHRDPVLRWDQLVAVYGSEQALVSSLSTIRGLSGLSAEDEGLLELVTKYEHGWRPSTPWAMDSQPQPSVMTSRNGPHDLLVLSGDKAPDLVLRAVASYEIDQARADRVSLRTRDVIDVVTERLDAAELAMMLSDAGVDAPSSGWRWSLDPTYDHNNLVVLFRVDPIADLQSLKVSFTCAVLMPTPQTANTGRVVVDVLIDRDTESAGEDPGDSSLAKLTLEEVRDIFVWALGAAGAVGDLLPRIVDDYALPPAGVELHIASRSAQSSRPPSTIEDMINLEPLGPRPGSGSVQPGQFSVPGAAPDASPEVRRALAEQGIRKMGENWGCLAAGRWQRGRPGVK
jgi:hypothetical protein